MQFLFIYFLQIHTGRPDFLLFFNSFCTAGNVHTWKPRESFPATVARSKITVTWQKSCTWTEMNVSKRKGLSAFGLKCNYIKCNHNSKAAGGCGGEEGGVGKTKETINSTVSAGVTEASASQRNATLHKLMASSLHHNGIRMNVSRKMFHYDVQGSVKKKKSKNNYRQKNPKQKKTK